MKFIRSSLVVSLAAIALQAMASVLPNAVQSTEARSGNLDVVGDTASDLFGSDFVSPALAPRALQLDDGSVVKCGIECGGPSITSCLANIDNVDPKQANICAQKGHEAGFTNGDCVIMFGHPGDNSGKCLRAALYQSVASTVFEYCVLLNGTGGCATVPGHSDLTVCTYSPDQPCVIGDLGS